jgi:transcriptional regulator
MYLPKQFEETDLAILHGLIKSHPFATLVTYGETGLEVNHLPFLLDPRRGESGTLRGHVARANPVWRQLSGTSESIAVFQGPECYISPAWYPSKQEHGKVVPTWNYAVVHAHGIAHTIEDGDWLLALVSELTDTHEAVNTLPWKVTDAPSEFIEKLIESIVGIEIPITKINGKWKVSQNRPPADRQGVIAGLQTSREEAAQAMAALVKHAAGG